MSNLNPALFDPANFALINTPKLLDLFDQLVITKAELTALQQVGLVSVRQSGAKGDSNGTPGHGTDDTAALNAALAGGGLIYVPPGTYRVTGSGAATAAVTAGIAGTTILLDPLAVIFLDDDTTNVIALDVAASHVSVLGRGQFKGSWDTTKNGTDLVEDDRNASKLIRIRPPVEDGAWITGIRVHGPRFTRSSGQAVVAVPNGTAGFSDVTIADCEFDTVYTGIEINGLPQAQQPHSVRIVGNTILSTAGPAAGTLDASKGGNAISVNQPVDDIDIVGNTISSCGRMGVEVWADTPNLAAGFSARNLRVQHNAIAGCQYRSISIGAVSADIGSNRVTGTVQGWDFVEVGGDLVTVHDNHLTGSGIVAGWSSATAPGWMGEGLVIARNRLQSVADMDTHMLRARAYRHVVVEDNVLICSHAVKSGSTDTLIVDLYGIDGLSVRRNDITYGGTCDRISLMQVALSRMGVISDNAFRLEGTPTPAEGILYLGNVEGIDVLRNTSFVDAELVLEAAVSGLGTGYTDHMTRLMRVGGAWVQDACEDGVWQDPPGAPTSGDIYVVGDAPTGAWAGNARTFAAWDGALWSHVAIRDVRIFDVVTELPRVSGTPTGVNFDGDAILLTKSGCVRCTYEGNDLTAGGAIRDSAGRRGIVTGGNDAIFWQSRFVANADHVRVADAEIGNHTIELMPAASPPTEAWKYFVPGTVVRNPFPVAGGFTGWVRTAADAWKGFGAVEA